MLKERLKGFVPVILIFVSLNGFFVSGTRFLKRWNADQDVLVIGNMVIFIITLFSFLLAQKGLSNPNPHAFVRSVYGSVLLKMFLCMIAAFIYIFTYRTHLNKPALFFCMGLYLVYTFMEVAALMKLLKSKAHG